METVNKYFKVATEVYNKELTIEQYLNNYEVVLNAESEIKAELKTKTVKVLKSVNHQLGNFTDSRDKKADLIDKAFDGIIDYFTLNRSIAYTWGEKTHEEARNELVKSTTAEFLSEFYAERKAKKEQKEKACENPETLPEFYQFVRIKGEGALTPEQLEKFEQLKADRVIEEQKQQEEEKKQQQRKFEISNNVEFELHETKHSKTGADLFQAVILNRVDRDTFKELRAKAKQFEGYYSRYSDSSANPPVKAGFNFSTKQQALQFIGAEETETVEQTETVEAAPEAKPTDKMRERAQKMIEKAEESLNQERKTNTYRQIDQAQRAEQKAESEIAFAKKMISIANGLDNGTIKYLYKLSNKAQLEQLNSILATAFYARTKEMSYTERQRTESNPALDVNFVKYPFPCYGANVIQDIFMKHEDTSGMKRDVQKILKHAKRYQDKFGLVTLTHSYDIKLFKSAALKLRDEWDKDRILDSIKDYERIMKMGLVDLPTLKTALRELHGLSGSDQLSDEEKKAKELKELERSFKLKKIDGFFPTPEPLIEQMFGMVKIYENDTILEPSAGLGHIAGAIKQRYPENALDVVEYNHSLFEVLKKKDFNAECADFLTTSKTYDVILMNPPFEKNQDIDHVMHAYKLLNEGGRMVAIMAGNKNGQSKKIKEFAEFVENNGYMVQNEEGSFKNSFRNTGVNTVTVYLEK